MPCHHTLSQSSGTNDDGHGASGGQHRYNERSRLKRSGPVDTNTPHPPAIAKGVLCGANLAHPWDTDIAASATERWDTRYRHRHGARDQLTDRAAQAGNTGSPAPLLDSLKRAPHGLGRRSRFYPGDARPERYQGRVAELTHDAQLASSGRRAPHRFTDNRSLPSRDEWVGARARTQERGRK